MSESNYTVPDWIKELCKEEVWKDIPEWEGFYQASSLGKIRSLTHQHERKYDGAIINMKGKELKPTKKNHGYLMVSLSKNGKITHRLVHRLVALSFLGKPLIGQEVCHFDDDKCNNRLDNLRWDTRQNNIIDRRREDRICLKLNKSTARQIRKLANKGELSQQEIGSKFNVSQNMVSSIYLNRVWKYE